MSSLVCTSAQCTFTRVDTNGYSYNNYGPPLYRDDDANVGDYYPTNSPAPADFSTNGTMYFDDTTAPWTDAANQDMLSDTVAITRDYRGGIFNALDPNEDQYNWQAPSNTEWALLPEGKTFEEARCQMQFCSWNDCFARYNPEYEMVGKPGVVHLIEEDVYYNILFTNWTSDCYGEYCSYPYYNRRRMDEDRPDDDAEDFDDDAGIREDDAEDFEDDAGNFNDDAGDYTNNGPPGGGFSYVRDAEPFTLADNLAECPSCDRAKADPAELTGTVDEKFVDVTITGVTPVGATIRIKAVSQQQNPACNTAFMKDAPTLVRPNAKFVAGDSTVQLRRTRTPGMLNAFRYTVYFDATNEAGTCSGQVSVCVPVEGFDCNTYLGFDATATSFCNAN